MITCRAILDLPRELLHHLAGLLAEHRRQIGTRRNSRALPCLRQALLALVWFRTGHDLGLTARPGSASPAPPATATTTKRACGDVLHQLPGGTPRATAR